MPKVHAFNTFFFGNYTTKGIDSVCRWTRKFNLFDLDLILVPIHFKKPCKHWMLGVINLEEKSVYLYDSFISLGFETQWIPQKLLNYIKDAHDDKTNGPLDTSTFELKCVKDMPQQTNGSDCGMFLLKCAEYLSRNASLTFTQEDMPYFRRRMLLEIVKHKII